MAISRERRAFLELLRAEARAPESVEIIYARLLEQHSPQGSVISRGSDEDEDDDEPATGLPVEVADGPKGAGLFPYQRELVEEATALQAGPPDSRIALLALPTGSGKTRIAVAACLRLLDTRYRRVLWVAPATELLEQAFSAFKLLVSLGEGPRHVELVRLGLAGEPGGKLPAVLFGTCQLLARRRSSFKARAIEPIDLIVFDEAHYALAPTYLEAIDALVRGSKTGTGLLGLTATPGRRDEEASERLVEVFRGRWLVSAALGSQPLTTLRDMGILSTLHFKNIAFEGSGPGTRLSRGDRKTQPARKLAYHAGRFRAVLETISAFPRGEQAIVFAASIEHGAALTAAVTDAGGSAALVSGYQDPRARRQALEAFERKEISVLINKAILIAGYDCPAVKHVLLTVPVRSAITFEQMVGRGSRGPKVGGNKESFVWQLDDMLALHGPPSSYSRYRDQSWLNRGAEH